MSAVTESSGNRAEYDGGAEWVIADCSHQALPGAALDVEDEIELLARLVGEEVADLYTSRVHEDVDAVVARQDLSHDGGDALAVGQVERMVVCASTRALDCLDR